ncbi:MAG: hypothetical protein ABL955_16360, partial [Elusimicrobiota bacterium]
MGAIDEDASVLRVWAAIGQLGLVDVAPTVLVIRLKSAKVGRAARLGMDEFPIKALAQASPYLLLLTATPHQGKTDAFRRLVALLDADALPDDESVTRDNVAPYVIR